MCRLSSPHPPLTCTCVRCKCRGTLPLAMLGYACAVPKYDIRLAPANVEIASRICPPPFHFGDAAQERAGCLFRVVCPSFQRFNGSEDHSFCWTACRLIASQCSTSFPSCTRWIWMAVRVTGLPFGLIPANSIWGVPVAFQRVTTLSPSAT